MNGDEMGIRVEENGSTRAVLIEGEMNIYRALELKEGLMKALDWAGPVEADLSGVTEFDSAGLQLLLLAGREAAKNGANFSVKAASAPVGAVVGLFCLNGVLGLPGREG